MFRTFIVSSRRFLEPRTLPIVSISPDVSSLGPTVIYDVRRNNRGSEFHRASVPPARLSELRRSILAITSCPQHPLLGSNLDRAVVRRPYAVSFQVPDPSKIVCNMLGMLKCVDLLDMKDAPPPAFWMALTIGGSQLVVPILELIGGYSPVMTIFQLNLAAVTLGFYGGEKWGLATSNNPEPTPSWSTMKWCALPPFIAVLGLTLPYPLGFLTVSAGMITSLYLDLKACIYSPSSCAMRLFVTLSTVTGLLLGLSAYVLFHNRQKEKEKEAVKKMKDKENLREAEDERNPEDDADWIDVERDKKIEGKKSMENEEKDRRKDK